MILAFSYKKCLKAESVFKCTPINVDRFAPADDEFYCSWFVSCKHCTLFGGLTRSWLSMALIKTDLLVICVIGASKATEDDNECLFLSSTFAEG